MTSTASWAPERVVDHAQAEQLIGRSFPELRGQPVQPLAEGWDNSVFVVGDELAFRFPRRAMAVSGVRREITVLPVIAPLVSLPIPTPTYVGLDEDADNPWPFFGARLIPGGELALSGLSDTARVRPAAGVGGFLRALHAPDILAAVQAASAQDPLPADPMNRAWPKARMADTQRLLHDLADDGAWAGDSRVDRLLDEAAELDAPKSDVALVHGDLHIRHLLVDTMDSEGASSRRHRLG